MIRQLAHLNFVTNDLEKIIDFYVNKLGMRVKFTLNNKEGHPFGYYFECGNTTFLEFFDQAMAAECEGDGGVSGQRRAPPSPVSATAHLMSLSVAPGSDNRPDLHV